MGQMHCGISVWRKKRVGLPLTSLTECDRLFVTDGIMRERAERSE